MEFKGPLPCPQEPFTGPHPDPGNPVHVIIPYLFKIHSNIILLPTPNLDH
jgi:hypothetical protein